MYITPLEFAEKYGLGNTAAELREYESLIRLACDRVDQYVGCPREDQYDCGCTDSCGSCTGNCGDTSCYPLTFPRSIDRCKTELKGNISTGDNFPGGNIGNYWLIVGDTTIGTLTALDGQYLLLETDTNYPLETDFQVLDEVPDYVCVVPQQVREAAFIMAKEIQATGGVVAAGCGLISSFAIGSVKLNIRDSEDNTTASADDQLSALLAGFVCRGYKLP